MRSDCRPHSGRNDIIKPNGRVVIASEARQPRGNEMPPAYTLPTNRTPVPPCHFERSREIPRNRNENTRTQIIIKNCRRSPLLSFPFWEIPTVVSLPRNDKLFRRMRRLIMFIRFKPNRTPKPPCHCEQRRSRSVAISRKGRLTCVHEQLKHLPPQAYNKILSPPKKSLKNFLKNIFFKTLDKPLKTVLLFYNVALCGLTT